MLAAREVPMFQSAVQLNIFRKQIFNIGGVNTKRIRGLFCAGVAR
jgi:thiamine monophosphate synthase